ncbi:transposase [Bradyrhizobium brasilense]
MPRRWSRDEKERLVAASLEPGASVSEVARRPAFM